MDELLSSRLPADPLRAWLTTDTRTCKKAQRLDAIETMIDYWVALTIERAAILDEHGRRLDALETASCPAVPAGYPCVEHVIEQAVELRTMMRDARLALREATKDL